MFDALLNPSLLTSMTQPVYDLNTGAVEYIETLARIQGDKHGNAHTPLIELAERHQFINVIDLIVLKEAVGKLPSHSQRIGVNLSPISIQKSGNDILAVLSAHSECENRVVLELTETAGINDLFGLKEFLREARHLRCRVAVDDYGSPTGSFSERLLHHIKPDYIKLDGTFLNRLIQDQEAMEFVRIKNLAKLLNAHLIAEWIDSVEKLKFIQTSGIRYVQGNYLQPATALCPTRYEAYPI